MIEIEGIITPAVPTDKLELSAAELARFWGGVDRKGEEECWNWQRGKDKDGYGKIYFHRKHCRSHRISFEIHTRLLLPGECACHTCDNPSCCNPGHIFPGTNVENIQDRTRKGRSASGDRSALRKHPELVKRGHENPAAILTEEEVYLIRAYHKITRLSAHIIGAHFGVKKTAAEYIVRGRSWSHLISYPVRRSIYTLGQRYSRRSPQATLVRHIERLEHWRDPQAP